MIRRLPGDAAGSVGGGASSFDGEDEEYVCYGDTVTLRSNALRRVMGVQKEKSADGPGETRFLRTFQLTSSRS